MLKLRLITFAFAICSLPLFAAEPEFVSLFNGKDLAHWDGAAGLWRVIEGCIEGGQPDGGPVPSSSYLILRDGDQDAILRNFHLRIDFWIETSNSGLQLRSTRRHGHSVSGYQAEVSSSPFSTGFLHQETKSGPRPGVGESMINEAGKGILVGHVADTKWLYAQKYYVPGQWSRYDVICRGNHLAFFVNGFPTVEYIDRDAKTPDCKNRNDDGILALQIHKADAFRVRYRDVLLKRLPEDFGDAARLFNDENLTGWNANEAWSVKRAMRDARGQLKTDATLVCNGSGKQPLVATLDPGPSFVFRCQVRTDAWKPGEKAPYKETAGWNLLEVSVQARSHARQSVVPPPSGDGSYLTTTKVELNGEPRQDIPLPVIGGRIALPSHIAAEYRNLVLIPGGAK